MLRFEFSAEDEFVEAYDLPRVLALLQYPKPTEGEDTNAIKRGVAQQIHLRVFKEEIQAGAVLVRDQYAHQPVAADIGLAGLCRGGVKISKDDAIKFCQRVGVSIVRAPPPVSAAAAVTPTNGALAQATSAASANGADGPTLMPKVVVKAIQRSAAWEEMILEYLRQQSLDPLNLPYVAKGKEDLVKTKAENALVMPKTKMTARAFEKAWQRLHKSKLICRADAPRSSVA